MMHTEHVDTTIERTCIECQQGFVISEEAQAFFRDKGLQLPKRCTPCRVQKRQRNEQTKSR